MLLICFYVLVYVWVDAGPEGSQHTLSFLRIISSDKGSIMIGLTAQGLEPGALLAFFVLCVLSTHVPCAVP